MTTVQPILPGSVIGVVGGGQLGRMLALEARRMGYRMAVLDPDPDSPACQIADFRIRGSLADHSALEELGHRSDIVTLEWENADAAGVRALAEITTVRPGAHVLEVAQHRLVEKSTARRLGLPTCEFRSVTSSAELHEALAAIGTPAVLKTCRGGYDGRGQVLIKSTVDADAALAALGGEPADLILESWVEHEIEISVICARSPAGEIEVFPIAENIHTGGILDFSIVPARVSPEIAREAGRIGEAMTEGLDVVGLLAVELFLDRSDRLLVNEIAPRPHNSGHWSWEGCSVSQFEQQLRAVCGLPLAQPRLLAPTAMANLLGQHLPHVTPGASVLSALAVPAVTLHLYGKRESRVGRKMGHLTALADDPNEALERVTLARDRLMRELETGGADTLI